VALSEVDILWVNMAENLIKQCLAKVSHIKLNYITKKKSNGLGTVTIEKKKMEGLWFQKQRLETFYSSAA
jgi:hypothetical protein